MALFLNSSLTFFPSLCSSRAVQDLLSHNLHWMSITACGVARLAVSHEVTSFLCCPKSVYPALSFEQSWENLCLSWHRWKIVGVVQGRFMSLTLLCKLTLLLLMSAHQAGSAIKLMPEGLVCTDEWNGNTGFELSLILPLRVCPLDFSSWSLTYSI